MKSLLLTQPKAAQGHKLTCVARVMKVQPVRQHKGMFIMECERDHWAFESGANGSIKTPVDHSEVKGYAPHAVGDVVIGKETWMVAGSPQETHVAYKAGAGKVKKGSEHSPEHMQDAEALYKRAEKTLRFPRTAVWRSSTQMPAWAARFHYEIMGVRCELKDDGKWYWIYNLKAIKE